MIKLTANETKALKVFPSAEYMNGTWYAEIGTWSFDFTGMIAGACEITISGAKGVMSSLVKKGLMRTNDATKADEREISCTDEGFAVINELMAADNLHYVSDLGWVPIDEQEEEVEEQHSEDHFDDAVLAADDDDLIGAPKTMLVKVADVKLGDVISGRKVGRLLIGRTRTDMWDTDKVEILYSFNDLIVQVTR